MHHYIPTSSSPYIWLSRTCDGGSRYVYGALRLYRRWKLTHSIRIIQSVVYPGRIRIYSTTPQTVLSGSGTGSQRWSRRLGLEPDQVDQLIDFYHAVEHLGKVASLRKVRSSKQRKSWVRKHRKLWLQGDVEQVICAINAICRSRRRKAIQTQRENFVKNSARMAYGRLRAIKMPIGSGYVESAIRRVVNLRLKGPCISWRKENAEAILLLRCYWKAGRWNMLENMANTFVPEAYA